MLQRQIMFKQLQELQQKQQLQELSNARDQNYINHPSSLKHVSGGQYPPTVNGIPLHDPSRMFMVGNMQMMQHVGLSQPQLDISLYGVHKPNPDKNLNQYSHLQGPSPPVNLLTKNNDSPLGISTMQPSAFGMSQQCNFLSDQVGMTNGSVLSNQEKDLFGQAPIGGFHGNASLVDSEGKLAGAGWAGLSPQETSKRGLSPTTTSLDPLEQKILYNTDDNDWESSFSRSSKMSIRRFESSNMEHTSHTDALLPSMQSGSWSALMQSAAAETSSNDPGVQEEWTGLSFQVPEPSIDNLSPSFIDSKKLQNNWVDRNLQNASSPRSKPEDLFQNFNMNCSFSNFQQSGHEYQQQKEQYHSESSHAITQSQLADYNSQECQLIQKASPSPNIWPGPSDNDARQPSLMSCPNDNQPHHDFSGNEFKGTFWLQGSTSRHVPPGGGIQKSYNQVNQLNIDRFSVEPERVASRENVEAVSTVLSASLKCPGENVGTLSQNMLEVLNKDDVSNDQTTVMKFNSEVSTPAELLLTETSVVSLAKTCKASLPPDFGFRLRPSDPQTPQSYSFIPSLSMGTFNATSLSGHNVNNHVEVQSPASPVSSHMANELLAFSAAASQDNSKLKIGSEKPVTPLRSDKLQQHVGFQMRQLAQWPDMASQQDTSSPKPYEFSSDLFRSPDSACSSLQTSSAALNEQNYQNPIQHEHNEKEFGKFSGKSEWHGQKQLEKECSLHEGSTEIYNSKQEVPRKHHLEADGVSLCSLMTNTDQQPSNLAEWRVKEFFFPATDIGAFSNSLSQNYSLQPPLHSGRNAEADDDESFPHKYDSVSYQHSIATAGELFLSGQKSGVKDRAKNDLNAAVSQLGAFWSGDNNFSQEGQDGQSGRAFLPSCHKNSQEPNLVVYQSQINLPAVQSLFKHYETLKNVQRFPMYDPHVGQTFSGMSLQNLPEIMEVNSANGKGSRVCPSTAATSIACKQSSTSSMLPSDVIYQKLAVSLPKKRKLVALDMIPWHNEVNHQPPRLQDISIAELLWAQASNRLEEEVKHEAEIVEELVLVIRAKRRLICTAQLMQQVFRPAPSVILCSVASSNCDCIAYSVARSALGDACSLTGLLPSESYDVLSNKLKASRSTKACMFSKIVDGFIYRVKKLEVDLTRLDKSFSFVDIKVEAQELEKFSTINRIAKFHIKAHPSTIDPASSGASTLNKTHPQRYVVGLPMPKIVPDGVDCLSL